MILKNGRIVTEDTVIENGYLIIENGVITEIGKDYQGDGTDLDNNIVMSGFIDGHIHGAMGFDFMDNDTEKYQKIVEYLPSEGVTGILATTMSQELNLVKDVVAKITSFKSEHTKILGIHLEGPFISKLKAGAQNPNFIYKPNVDDFEFIRNGSNMIKVVTYAVEEDSEFEFTNHLIKHGIHGSIGHSDAKMCECNKCFDIGVTRITHLYNGMKPFHHRNTGAVNSAFLNRMLSELIVDKIHVDSDVVKTTYQVLGSDKIILITDAMRAKGLSDGEFELGGQKVIVSDGAARLESGALAGSTLKYDMAIRNMQEITECSLIDLAHMASINQAKNLNLKTGIIKKDYCADLVILDNNLNVINTYIDGNKVY